MNSPATSGLIAEFTAAHVGVAVGRPEPRSLFELRGNDRQKFLHNFCTNDIKSLKPGEGCEALMTSVQGKVLAHLTVQAGQEALWIEASGARREIIEKHLNKYLITEDVKIEDQTADYDVLLVCGATAIPMLKKGGLTLADAPLLSHGKGVYCNLPVEWQRVLWTTVPGWTLRISSDESDGLITALTTAGAVGLSASVLEALRIEAGFPRDGIDFTDANLAQELARTDRCISFRKGCYLGQEPIARIDSMGHVNQELRRVTIAASASPQPGLTLVDSSSEKEAGTLTSISAFPVNGHWFGLAMLRRAFLAPATEIRTDQWKVRVED